SGPLLVATLVTQRLERRRQLVGVTWVNRGVVALDGPDIRLDIAGRHEHRRESDLLLAVVGRGNDDRHASAMGDMVEAGFPLLRPRARPLRGNDQRIAVA